MTVRKIGLVAVLAALVVGLLPLLAFGGGNYEEKIDYCDPANKPGGVALATWLADNGNPDCIDLDVDDECGIATGEITRDKTPEAWNWAVAFEEGAATYNLGVAQFGSISFPEDHNGGSVTVSYYLVGPESDYGKISGEPNFWNQNAGSIEVDTDCIDEETTTTTIVEETTTTTAPEIDIEEPRLFTTEWCGGSDQLHLPADGAVIYLVDGQVSAARAISHSVPGESRTVVITAVDAEGTVLATWEFTLRRQANCAVAQIPTVVADEVEEPLTELPFTGPGSVLGLIGLGTLLAGGGVSLVRSALKRDEE